MFEFQEHKFNIFDEAQSKSHPKMYSEYQRNTFWDVFEYF